MGTFLLSEECRDASVIQMLEIINDRGLGLNNKLLRSYYLKRSKKDRRFLPRTGGPVVREGDCSSAFPR